MRGGRRHRVVVVALGICVAGSLPQAVLAWEASLLGDASAERDARAPLVLVLSGVPPGIRQQLLVELDRVDVTALVQAEDDRLIATPVAPLDAGPHELRLLEWSLQGGVDERGSWVFQVAAGEGFAIETGNVRFGTTGSVRIADDRSGPGPDILQSNGGIDGAVSATHGALALQAHGAGYYDTVEQNLGGQEADLGPFLVEARGPHTALRYGHHALGPSSLVMQGFERRGLSGELESTALRTRVDAFVLRGSPVIGTRGGSGLEDRGDRVAGLAIQSRPLEAGIGALDLSGVLVDGAARAEGTELSGVSGDPVESDGRAWSARLDGRLWGERLAIFGEYARARFDPDGSGAARGETDDARWVGIRLVPFPELSWRGQPVLLDLSVEESAIGTWFRSPANPAAPQDRHIQSAVLHAARAGLDLRSALAREEDNVDGLDELPRMRSDLVWVDLVYTPVQWSQDAAPTFVQWIGLPTLHGYYSNEKLDPTRVPSVLGTQAATLGVNSLLPDQRVQTGYAGFSFAKPLWSWQVGQRLIDTDSSSDSFPSTRIYQTEFSGNALVGSRLSLGPYLSFDSSSSPDSPRTHALLLGGQISATLLREILGLRFDGSYAQIWSSRGTGLADGHTTTTSASLDWTALAAMARRPGLLVSLLGTWQEQRIEAPPASTSDAYQIFLQATLSWSRQWGI